MHLRNFVLSPERMISPTHSLRKALTKFHFSRLNNSYFNILPNYGHIFSCLFKKKKAFDSLLLPADSLFSRKETPTVKHLCLHTAVFHPKVNWQLKKQNTDSGKAESLLLWLKLPSRRRTKDSDSLGNSGVLLRSCSFYPLSEVAHPRGNSPWPSQKPSFNESLSQYPRPWSELAKPKLRSLLLPPAPLTSERGQIWAR